MILAINPGSTSTKIGLFDDTKSIFETTIRHSADELASYSSVFEQLDFRRQLIQAEIQKSGFSLSDLKAVVGRGGLLKPLEGGTYLVNETMKKDLSSGVYGVHASNLGAIIADEIAKKLSIDAYIVDPVCVDEFHELSRISGHKLITRKSTFHALNQKAVAKRYAKDVSISYEELNLIVAHLGGGVSVGVHQKGRVVDVNNALDGDGPFSPERSGSLPMGSIIDLCFDGNYSKKEIKEMITGKGGFVSYLGLNDARDVLKLIKDGDSYAKLIYEAMTYQIAKEIGSAATVLSGKVDAIILTGGLAFSEDFTNLIKSRVEFISKVSVYPGEDELFALYEGVKRVLNKEEQIKIYD